MAEMPTCRKCGNPHWRFQKCDTVTATPTPRPTPQKEWACPPGYVRLGPNRFARADAERPGLANQSAYIQVAPNKFVRRKAA